MSEPGDDMGSGEGSSESSNEMGSADMSGVEMDCAGLADVAAELALGVLTGRERAAGDRPPGHGATRAARTCGS